jgi:hypothetical protein
MLGGDRREADDHGRLDAVRFRTGADWSFSHRRRLCSAGGDPVASAGTPCVSIDAFSKKYLQQAGSANPVCWRP